MNISLNPVIGLGVSLFLWAGTLSCGAPKEESTRLRIDLPPKPEPKGYVCYRPAEPIIIDGQLNERAWSSVPWTDYFQDIEGSAKPLPRFHTRAKLLWDSTCLFIAAELEEPHLWGRLKQRDTVIFYDPDFEVFIDPDGDTHGYYELEINALGTAWDLLLPKPYRDGGPAINSWDIQGLRVGIKHQGTLNQPDDIDQGWSLELALPWSVLKEYAAKGNLPVAGDQWRINFSRVEWKIQITDRGYTKETDPSTGKPLPEDNWVWSPQGRINMHMPEMWGYLQFSDRIAGQGTDPFQPDPDLDAKWALRMVYYAQVQYFAQHQVFAKKIRDLGLTREDFPATCGVPQLQATDRTFETWLPEPNRANPWTLREDGRLFRRPTAGDHDRAV